MSLRTTLESSDKIKYEIYLSGITEETVRAISAAQDEPDWMLKLRLDSFEIFKKLPMPSR
jgi:Fe-S cluster assembly protein SufB